MAGVSRRTFITGSAIAAGALSVKSTFAQSAKRHVPFEVAVINDEISPDFDHACSVAANDFGLQWIELRGMWGKGLVTLSDAELAQVETILAKYSLRVTDIASPLFKVDWPGAPTSRFGPKNKPAASSSLKDQDELLERSIALAKRFKTNRVRCFDFWRLEDVAPHRAAINAKLMEAATTCSKHDVLLVLENEFECNTATGREAAATLAAVQSPYLMLNWDPANAVMAGELDTYPVAWDLLPKQRIGHCHCKNAVKDNSGKVQWAPVGTGFIDWPAQFKALSGAGYRQAVSLETHWRGAGTPEASTRVSMTDLKTALRTAGYEI